MWQHGELWATMPCQLKFNGTICLTIDRTHDGEPILGSYFFQVSAVVFTPHIEMYRTKKASVQMFPYFRPKSCQFLLALVTLYPSVKISGGPVSNTLCVF